MKLSIQLLSFLIIVIITSCNNNNNNTVQKAHIKESNKEVLYYGSVHSNDTTDVMFNDIEKSFQEFMPEMVLIEGGYNSSSYSTKNEAIQNGEMAFMSYLADQHNVEKQNIEPSGKYVDSLLLEKYSREQILTMYVLRQTHQYIKQIKHSDFSFSETIVDYVNNVNKSHFDKQAESLNFEVIFKMVEQETGIAITEDNWREKEVTIRRYVFKEGSISNEIYNTVLDLRDMLAVEKIIKTLHMHNKVFVIMGNQHLINQRSILREKMVKDFGN